MKANVLMLTGPSGCGKTTVLNLVYDDLKRKGGEEVQPRKQLGENPRDFEVVMRFRGKRIVFFTMGDYSKEISAAMHEHADANVLIMACNSKHKMPLKIMRNFPNRRVFTKTKRPPKQRAEYDHKVAEEMLNALYAVAGDAAVTLSLKRPRRLRGNPFLRGLVRETRLSADALIYPVFVKEGHNLMEPIATMEGQYRYSVDRLGAVFDAILKAGVNKVLFFGIPQEKDPEGAGAYCEDGVVQNALRHAAERYPEIYRISDVCLCEYTSHGHCGVLSASDSDSGAEIDNDRSLEALSATACSHVAAGSQMVAPSDMMDGRVRAIRAALDAQGRVDIPIMSYAVKYSSAFYDPFRDAADCAPHFGDRKTYQMDYHNQKEGIKEALSDVEEGADIILVKPALAYLDVIERVAARVQLPVAAYSVSGEYAMIKAAARAGFLDEEAVMCESAVSVFRAGANILISYFAKEIAACIRAGRIG